MIIVAQPRHAFACARGRGKTGVTVTVTGLSLRCFSSSSIFNKTLREEPSLHRSEFPIHVHGPVFMALCRLSRVPWSEVEGQTSPGDEPTVTLAQLHSELSSRASTTT
jgi:hypothetical protein